VTISLNVTATLVAAIQEVVVLEVLNVVVVVPGFAVVVAEVADPVAVVIPVDGV